MKKTKKSQARAAKIEMPTWCKSLGNNLLKMQVEANRVPTAFQIAQLSTQFVNESDFDDDQFPSKPRLKASVSKAIELYFCCAHELASKSLRWQKTLNKQRLEIEYRKRFKAPRKLSVDENDESIEVTREMFLEMQMPHFRNKPDKLREVGIRFASYIKSGQGLSLAPMTFDEQYEYETGITSRNWWFNAGENGKQMSDHEALSAYDEWAPLSCSDDRLLLLTTVFRKWRKAHTSQTRSTVSKKRWDKQKKEKLKNS